MRKDIISLIGLLLLTAVTVSHGAEVYLADGSTLPLPASDLSTPNSLPVLFVHGHNLDSNTDADFNYQKNWQNSLTDLQGTWPSFKSALDLPANRDNLGIEPYYIRFQNQDHSVVEDARDIGEAIGLILERHDPTYDRTDLTDRSHVQVVVIAYSKGTISTRLYLKSLQTAIPNLDPTGLLPAPRPDFRPVSEFIAISSPNHGLQPLVNSSGRPAAMSLRQLQNGYDRNCNAYDTPAEAGVTDFIISLNATEQAPGSRANDTAPHLGTLYVSIFPSDDRDIVGGESASGDCQGRKRAANLGTHAINIPVPEVVGSVPAFLSDELKEIVQLAIHQRAVHTPAVMCWALYIAAHHKVPPLQQGVPCSSNANNPPEIPVPPRASVALALDFSGSMNSAACPQADCATRRLVLQEAVELFVRIWGALGGPGDRLGVSYFRTDVTPLNLGADSLILLHADENSDGVANWQDIINDVNSQDALNLTAMGGGLQNAINSLSGTVNNRRVILFTDGLQNVNPMVLDKGQHREINDEPGRPHDSNIDPSTPVTILSTIGMPIDVIGVGEGAAFVNRLEQIRQDTSGYLRVTTDPEQDLRQFFLGELVNSLRGFSPQLLAYRHGALSGDVATETFNVSKQARKLVFKLSWRQGQELALRVQKDGVDVTSLGRLINGSFYRILVFDQPARLVRNNVDPAGDWQIQIQGKPGTAYQAAAIVDEPLFEYDFSLGTQAYRAGDKLNLELRPHVGGKALMGEMQITASVAVPRQSVGTLLSQTSITSAKRHVEAPTTLAQRKLESLLQDKKTWQKLRPEQQAITLKRDEKGVYRAQFGPVTVPGVYTVKFHIQGNTPKLGSIQRTETVSILVRFGAVEPGTSSLKKISQSKEVGIVKWALSMRPRDKFGNYLGPGLVQDIRLTVPAGTTTEGVVDHGDGTYTQVITYPQDADPEINVTVSGDELYAGPVSGIAESDTKKGVWIFIVLAILVLFFLVRWFFKNRQA